MPRGRTGLTPRGEVNTIRRVSNQGSRFKLIFDEVVLRVRRAVEMGARSPADPSSDHLEASLRRNDG